MFNVWVLWKVTTELQLTLLNVRCWVDPLLMIDVVVWAEVWTRVWKHERKAKSQRQSEVSKVTPTSWHKTIGQGLCHPSCTQETNGQVFRHNIIGCHDVLSQTKQWISPQNYFCQKERWSTHVKILVSGRRVKQTESRGCCRSRKIWSRGGVGLWKCEQFSWKYVIFVTFPFANCS